MATYIEGVNGEYKGLRGYLEDNKMNLYDVFNGYTGNSHVYVTVIAENEERARVLAENKYREEVKNSRFYDEKYFANLEVKLLHEDCTKEFVSEVSE